MKTLRAGIIASSLWLLWLLSIAVLEGPSKAAGGLGTARTFALAGVAVLSLFWIWERCESGEADLFSPTHAFPVAYVLWFALAGIDFIEPVAETRLWDPIPFRTLLLAALGLVVYLLTLSLLRAPSRSLSDKGYRESLRASVRRWERERVTLGGAAFLVIIFGAYADIVRAIGIPILSSTPALARLAIRGHGIVFAVFYCAILAYVPLSLAWIWGGAKVSLNERRTVWLSLVSIVLFVWSLGNRGLVIEPALLALLTMHYFRHPIGLRLTASVSVLGAIFLSTMGLWRDVKQYGPGHIAELIGWGFPLWSLPFTYIYSYVRDPVVTFTQSMQVIPHFVPYQHGGIFLSPIITVLPGHQESSDFFFKRILHNDFIGMGRPATLLGSLYADAGVVGVIAGLFIFGLIAQLTYRRLMVQPTSTVALMHVWISHVALLSLFSSLFPYPTTVFVPLLIWSAIAFVKN